MAYEPPNGKKIKFNFTGTAYTPPAGNRLNFNFTENSETPGGDTQYLFPVTWESFESSSPSLRHQYRYLIPIGFNQSGFGNPNLYNKTQNITGIGFNASAFGTANLINKNKTISTNGFLSEAFGNSNKIYNLKQIVNVTGFNASTYGTAYLQGGVKYIHPNGINSLAFGPIKAINTKADQFANLNGYGISPPALPSPTVTPRILYPVGIKSDRYGQALIQRSPMPDGIDAARYGLAWVSHSPRYLQPGNVDAFNAGYPTVYDPTQKILLDDKGIEGGIFGDTAIRNTRRLIVVDGFYSQQFSDWSIVESNLRTITTKGFDSQSFGSTSIKNKIPTIRPLGFDSFNGLQATAIGYRVREVKPSGFYQPKFGQHKLEKPPEIHPLGFENSAFGTAFISNFKREIYAGIGKDSQEFGGLNVWFKYRVISLNGFEVSSFGGQRIEHGRRTILALGSDHSRFSTGAWLSDAVRTISPTSIDEPKIPIHKVGGTQHLNPTGFDALAFGERIIPESQSIYPRGFSNLFGLTTIDLHTKFIEPKGFLTFGLEPTQRFGHATFYNLKQYITQVYDANNGLVPPKMEGWTSIENRNKTIGAIGSEHSRVGNVLIDNNARLIEPIGFDALSIDRSMIADRIRSIHLEGIEPSYIGGWTVIYNDARVIQPIGVNGQTIGQVSIQNTRRYYQRIGNFDSLEMGTPMIADRVRTLSFEQRYSIEPPAIPLPSIELYVRYIDEVGRNNDFLEMGSPSLSIHWNIIKTGWTLRDAYGYPTVKNVTPELPVYGHNSEEFGTPEFRLQWRALNQKGDDALSFGKPNIAFRDRKFSVNGFNGLTVSDKLKVTKTGAPPYSTQYIQLNSVDLNGEITDGFGIYPPNNQVPKPSLNQSVIYLTGFNSMKIGEPSIQSNGIVIDAGIPIPDFENGPLVTLKNRTVKVDNGIDSTIVCGIPRFSPHTIYAVMEAPAQAIANHPSGKRHYVNSDGGTRLPGEVFGRARVSLKYFVVPNVGLGNLSGYGVPSVQLKRRYIEVRGFQSYRIGIPNIGDGTQFIKQFGAIDNASVGAPTLSRNEPLHRVIKPSGFNALSIPNIHWVSLLHRTLTTVGVDSLRMGTRLSGDKPFMWQGLRVGELVKGNYGGFDNLTFGVTWVSLRIRELKVDGFDSFACEYDYTAFEKRMRVTRTEVEIPSRSIQAVGFDASCHSVPNIKPAAHYIRPDGNADQYRKGAF
jgi:hypothetical protein